jgi:hypothetical protein
LKEEALAQKREGSLPLTTSLFQLVWQKIGAKTFSPMTHIRMTFCRISLNKMALKRLKCVICYAGPSLNAAQISVILLNFTLSSGFLINVIFHGIILMHIILFIVMHVILMHVILMPVIVMPVIVMPVIVMPVIVMPVIVMRVILMHVILMHVILTHVMRF